MKKWINNIFAYHIGWIRYYLFYSRTFGRFMRTHIREQINNRIKVMNKDCYEQGSCTQCGCATPALQMANKPCEGDCYPKMQNKMDWELDKITKELNL